MRRRTLLHGFYLALRSRSYVVQKFAILSPHLRWVRSHELEGVLTTIYNAGKNNFLPASVYFLNVRGHGNYDRDLFYSQLRNLHFQLHILWFA